MTRTHRQRHRVLWLALAPIATLALFLGVWLRHPMAHYTQPGLDVQRLDDSSITNHGSRALP